MGIIANSKEDYIKQLKTKLATDDIWAQRGLLAIYKNQTYGEQQTGDVREYNCIGFTGTDAKFLTSLAKRVKYNGFNSLSIKQNQYLKKCMPKYARQLLNDCIESGSVVKINGQYMNKAEADTLNLKY